MTTRFLVIGVLLLALSVGITANANARPHAGVPASDCRWQQNGIELDGWLCVCQRVRFGRQWDLVCAWHLATTVDTRKRIVKAKLKPRFGIGVGVVSHA